MSTSRLVSIAGICVLALLADSRAVLFDSTADPAFNTTEPGGTLAGSGWQFEGQWGGFLGTVIADHFFITARHIGGTVGQPFKFKGATYTTTAFFDDPNSDLRICKVDGVFPVYAQIYSKTDEVGTGIVVFGRGTQRGAAVTLNGTPKGWLWGTNDTVQRWGENKIAGIYEGGNGMGSLLRVAFDHGAGTNEATLSVNDSGGGVFIRDGPAWKLAGINFQIDGPYSTSPNGSAAVSASLFDQVGYFSQNAAGKWVANSGPGSWYATRISSHLTWIRSIVPQAPPQNGTATALQNSVPVRDRSSAMGDRQFYGISVPEGATSLTIILSGGTGNADVYVKFGSPPGTNDYDYAAAGAGNREIVRFVNPQAGDWFILLNASPAYNGATLLARYAVGTGLIAPPVFLPGDGLFAGRALVRLLCPTGGVEIHYTTDGSDPVPASPIYGNTPVLLLQNATLKARAFKTGLPASPAGAIKVAVTPDATTIVLQSGVALTNLAGSGISGALFRIALPAGQGSLILDNYGSNGATDLFVKFGAQPTATVFDQHLKVAPGHERLAIPNPAAGDWFILLQGKRDFSNTSLKAQFQ